MQKYDILFYKGNNILSKIVKWFTKSEYSHCGIFIDEFHIVEINYSFRYKIRHNKYKSGTYDIYRCNAEFNKNKLDEYIHNTLQQRYDFRELLRIIGFRLCDNTSKIICSECVFDAFAHAGLELLDNDTVSPQDLCESKYLTKL